MSDAWEGWGFLDEVGLEIWGFGDLETGSLKTGVERLHPLPSSCKEQPGD
jgi:hypothetical protein